MHVVQLVIVRYITSNIVCHVLAKAVILLLVLRLPHPSATAQVSVTVLLSYLHLKTSTETSAPPALITQVLSSFISLR
jgi:hypothetical protein